MGQQDHQIKMKAEGLNFYYGAFQALKNIHLEVKERQITSLIGPSGCGKSTFLRTLNRMNDLIPHTRVDGTILLDGQNIYSPEVNAHFFYLAGDSDDRGTMWAYRYKKAVKP